MTEYREGEKKVLLSLLYGRKRYRDLLNETRLARPSLSEDLNLLESKGLVLKEGNGFSVRYSLTPQGTTEANLILELEGAKREAELDVNEESAGWGEFVAEFKERLAFSRNPFVMSFFTLYNEDLHKPESFWKAGAKTVFTLGLYNIKLLREEIAIPEEDRAYYEFLAAVYVDSVTPKKDEAIEVWRTRIKPSWALANGFREQCLGFDFESAFKRWQAGAIRPGGASERAWIKKLEVNLLEQFQKDCHEAGMPTGRDLDSTSFLQLLAWCRIKQRALGSVSYSKIWKEVLLQGLRAIGFA